MKFFITVVIITWPFWTNAQAINQNETYTSPNERLSLIIGLGPRISWVTVGKVSTFLESKPEFNNVTNIFEGEKDINSPFVLFGYQTKMAYTHSFGLSHAMQLDIAFGINKAFFGGYAIAWEILVYQNKNKLSLQPGLAIMLGYSQYFIGELNPLYGDSYNYDNGLIQIGNTQYFGDRLGMHITQDNVAFIYGPEIALNFRPSISNVGIQFSTAYYLSGSASEAIVIFDPIQNDFPKASSLSASSPLLNVYYEENTPLTDNPFNYGGLRVSFSVVFDF